ncbi:hypothetical protein N7493_002857 [Penicillium malachiteum]|uniref:Uncharacterized protein n=1 Tax=Penicillium malachiteum TaxID=1324776 RepID=A0AAD6HSM6_9EURO|nr:hypothetical protein N7493_002857 [Penicillium malachiteum]
MFHHNSAQVKGVYVVEDGTGVELLSRPQRSASLKYNNTRSKDQKEPERLRKWKWGSITVDILCILLVVPFLFLVIFCAEKHKKTVDESELNRMNQGLWASATAFTLVFSALGSRMTKRIAEWRLERGSQLYTLETLNGSSTFINALVTQLRLRNFGILSLSLALLWSVSPVGSQSPLHVLSTAQTVSTSHQSVGYRPINTSSVVDGAADLDYYAPYIDALYTTSIIAAGTFRYSSMDPWVNLKIPSFEALSSAPNSTGWVSVPQADKNITYSALTGVPLSGLNETGNVTTIIESTYFSLSLVNTTGTLKLAGNGVVANLTCYESFEPWDDSSPGANETFYVVFSPVNQSFEATFQWTQKYFYSEVGCVVTGDQVTDRDCSVKAMKTSRSSTPPEFNWITIDNIGLQWNSLLSGQNFSLSEAYIRYPQSPLDAQLSDTSTASPSIEDLRVRLSQLLNTIFFSTTDPTGSLQGEPSDPVYTSAARVSYNPGSIYSVNFVWLGIFLVATIIMAAAAVVTLILTLLSLNPDVLGYVSTFIWSSPSLDLPQSGTFIPADRKTRSIRPLEIRLGDLRGEEEIGELAVGSIFDTTQVRPGRLYQ